MERRPSGMGLGGSRKTGIGSSSLLQPCEEEQALNSLRERCALAKMQHHNDMWEVVNIYDDSQRLRAGVDPWKGDSIESRGMRLQEIAPEELKVKDENCNF